MPKARERLSADTADSAESPRPPEGFEEFYRREYQGVVALVYGLSGSRAAAEDLAQEAFLAAHRDWERLAAWDHRAAWVRRVAANLALAVSNFRTRLAEARALVRLAGQRQPAWSHCPTVMPTSGVPSAACQNARLRLSPCTTSRTSPCSRSPRSWAARKAP